MTISVNRMYNFIVILCTLTLFYSCNTTKNVTASKFSALLKIANKKLP